MEIVLVAMIGLFGLCAGLAGHEHKTQVFEQEKIQMQQLEQKVDDETREIESLKEQQALKSDVVIKDLS